jgi:hypothetical protein
MCDLIHMISLNLARFSLVVCLCACATAGVSARSDSELVEQLRADYAALQDARVELDRLETEQGSQTAEQTDYADWIQQLGEDFAQRCRELANRSPELIPAEVPCADFEQTYTAPADINIEHEASDSEEISKGVSEFEQSLGDFDEKLLREQDRVKAQKPQSSASDSGGGAAGDAGGESGGGESGGGDAEESAADGAQSGQPSDQQGSAVGNDEEQTARSSKGSSPTSSAPPGTPDGSDDDVIARQLREAAENEADPELKKKLWEEYARYKKDL